jgi:hypothetical protein
MSVPLEFCREWVEDKTDRCNEPAIIIIWGKLFPAEALGPRCQEHAAKHLPDLSLHTITQWAVFDLRGLERAKERTGG